MASSTALEVQHVEAPRGLMHAASIAEINAQRNALVDCMKRAMRKDHDYGVIPGTGDKNTLLKPGSEKILALFRLAARPIVEDLSTPDTIRYRVTVEVTTMGSNAFVGAGIGEASSAESKYQWRAAVCDDEFAATPEDRRRLKWKKGNGGRGYTLMQVRADMEDVANTVLKMAKKRAQIDAVLTVTAASDIFAQDLEDLQDTGFEPGGFDEPGAGDDGEGTSEPPPRQQEFQRRQEPARAPATAPAPANGVKRITEAQAKLFFARAMNSGKTKDAINEYLEQRGCKRSDELPATDFNAALDWANGKA